MSDIDDWSDLRIGVKYCITTSPKFCELTVSFVGVYHGPEVDRDTYEETGCHRFDVGFFRGEPGYYRIRACEASE